VIEISNKRKKKGGKIKRVGKTEGEKETGKRGEEKGRGGSGDGGKMG